MIRNKNMNVLRRLLPSAEGLSNSLRKKLAFPRFYQRRTRPSNTVMCIIGRARVVTRGVKRKCDQRTVTMYVADGGCGGAWRKKYRDEWVTWKVIK